MLTYERGFSEINIIFFYFSMVTYMYLFVHLLVQVFYFVVCSINFIHLKHKAHIFAVQYVVFATPGHVWLFSAANW